MARSSESEKQEAGSSENPSPSTTILGRHPPEGQGDLPPVPTGIQKLLRLAGEDPQFRQLFLTQRANVSGAAGIDLTGSERAILAAVPARQLEAMIDRVPPAAPDRREFFRQTAASAVVLLGGATLGHTVSGCEKKATSLREDDPSRPDRNTTKEVGGAAPDEPPVRPDRREMETDGGSAPDLPPRPDRNPMAPGGSRPDTDAGRPNPTRGIRPDLPPDRDPF